MEIVFLGTSSMVPTHDRNHSSIFVEIHDQGILFDCGEGTQRQLKRAGIKLSKISKICISHWHGDHILGLPGLLQSMAASEISRTVDIYGPKGTKKFLKNMFLAFSCENIVAIKIHEIISGKIVDHSLYEIRATELQHNILNFGYAIIEKPKRKINIDFIKQHRIPHGPLLGKLQSGKSITFNSKRIIAKDATHLLPGKKIVIVTDTLVCATIVKLAKDADLFVCEATYDSTLLSKAKEHKHMTSIQAANLAKKSNVKKLVLTHFSSRYKDVEMLANEAKTVFPNTIAAKDFMKLKI